MAFVLLEEPGNGKTFFVDNLCTFYRQFLSIPENRRYTFNVVNLDKLGGYGKIGTIQSQTFEDPVILAMNLFESRDDGKEFLAALGDFSDDQIDRLYHSYRPLMDESHAIRKDVINYVNMIIGIDAENLGLDLHNWLAISKYSCRFRRKTLGSRAIYRSAFSTVTQAQSSM
jgi:hypothetical protein